MRLLKQALAVLGALVVVAVIAALVAPKAARAVANGMVEVTNTATNPVPNLDVNTPGEEPFETVLCLASGTGLECPTTESASSFVVPTTTTDGAHVRRLVIENLSGNCGTSTGPVLAVGVMSQINENVVNGEQTTFAFAPAVQGPAGGSAFGQQIRFYADPGSTVTLATVATSTYVCGEAINGYFVTR